jgi:hypothetical protein
MLLQCPTPATLAAIPAMNCPIKFDQIQRIAFGRKTTDARFDTEAEMITQAARTSLLAASDATKIVISLYFTDLTISVGEPIKTGGNDNTTINGISELQGGPSLVVPFICKNISAGLPGDCVRFAQRHSYNLKRPILRAISLPETLFILGIL